MHKNYSLNGFIIIELLLHGNRLPIAQKKKIFLDRMVKLESEWID